MLNSVTPRRSEDMYTCMYTCIAHVQVTEIIVLYHHNFAFLSPFSKCFLSFFSKPLMRPLLQVNLGCLVDLYFRKEDYAYDDIVSLITSYVKKAVCTSMQDTHARLSYNTQ